MHVRRRWMVGFLLGLAGTALAAPRLRLTLEDGGVVEGELARFEAGTYSLTVGGRTLTYAEGRVRRVELLEEAAPAAPFDLSRLGRYRPRPGDRWRAGRTRREQDQETSCVYVERIEAVDEDGRVVARVRTYEALDGVPVACGEVRITRRAGVLERAWADPTRVEPALDARLKQELGGGAAPDAEADWRPGRPVRVGESWKVAAGELLLAVPELRGGQLERSQGTLRRVYEQGGTPWAESQVELSARGEGGAEIELTLTLRGPLGGGSSAWEEEASGTAFRGGRGMKFSERRTIEPLEPAAPPPRR